VFVAALVGLGTNIVLNYPAYLLFGMAGPALASILAQVAAIVVLVQSVRGQLGVTWATALPYMPLLRTLGVAWLASIPLWLLMPLVTSPVLAMVGGLVVYIPTYIACGLAFGILSRADLRYALDYLTGRLVKQAKGDRKA
jgi:peptidoglycan biosynthesis protein MviN/MurJ (putative lipid II flippase)